MSTIKSSSEDLTLDADGGSSEIKLKINNVEKASIGSAGAFTSTTIDATKLTGNLPAISGASLTSLPSHSGNVAFPATQVASADANCLDDYEEGSFTPTVWDATSGGNQGTITTTSHCKYTKVGDTVFANFSISGTNITGMTGGNNAYFRGLPFTASSTSEIGGGVYLQANGFPANSNVNTAAYFLQGSISYFTIDWCTSGAFSNPMTCTELTTNGNTKIRCTIIYKI